jgi:hypothetical protein
MAQAEPPAKPVGPGITASPCFWSRAALTKPLLWWRSDEVNAQARFVFDSNEPSRMMSNSPRYYFHPVDFLVKRAGSWGLASGAGSGSPAAAAISRSSSSSLGSPAS